MQTLLELIIKQDRVVFASKIKENVSSDRS